MRLPKLRHLLKAALIALFLCACAWPAAAQEKPAKPEKKEEQTATIRVDTELVSVDVTMTDCAGKRNATALRAEDFVIYEDGVRQKVSNFSTTDVPFNLVLVIDTSGSTH